MDVRWSPIASKQLGKLTKIVQRRIAEKLRLWSVQADPFRFAELMVGIKPPQFRFRVGEYRIIVGRADRTLTVLRVADRKDVYR